MEDDATHARQLGAAGLERIAGALHRLLRLLVHLRLRLFLAGVEEAAVVPVAMRTQHARQLARLARGPIEIAADVVAGHTGEVDLFDGVISAIDPAMDHRRQRRLRRHRPEAIGHENLLAQVAAASLPRLFGGRGLQEEVLVVQVARLAETVIGGLFAFRQHARRVGSNGQAGQAQGEQADAGGGFHGRLLAGIGVATRGSVTRREAGVNGPPAPRGWESISWRRQNSLTQPELIAVRRLTRCPERARRLKWPCALLISLSPNEFTRAAEVAFTRAA